MQDTAMIIIKITLCEATGKSLGRRTEKWFNGPLNLHVMYANYESVEE